MKTKIMLASALTVFLFVGQAVADQGSASVVVADNEGCPQGKKRTSLVGGEGDASVVCVTPNTNQMLHDATDYSDPGTADSEYTGNND